MRSNKEENYISFFNPNTGQYMRTGILKDGKDTGIDPFMAQFPELLDVGIMGHCIHGAKGLCVQAGVECYQNGLESCSPNMRLDDFKLVVQQCKEKTYQIALGGCGDPDQHESFEEILMECRNNGIVPNFTTSGSGMTEQLAKICANYCGAVAVSWYRSEYTMKAIQLLHQAGVKTNIHYVLNKETIHEALFLLKNKRFPQEINSVVFLLHKPIGLGSEKNVITRDNEEFTKLIDCLTRENHDLKIGFDSCTVPMLVNNIGNIDMDCLDTCEGARWSAYITPDMKMLPCSFDNQDQRWAVDLRKHSMLEAWNSNEFENFRSYLRGACPKCSLRNLCMGGCPICPQINVCENKERM